MTAWKSRPAQRHRRAATACRSISLIESRGRGPAEPVEDLRARRARLPRSHAALASSASRRICLVFGSSTAGGAYIPGMSDYVVMVEKQAQVYLGGPAAREDGDRRGHRPRGARRRRDARARLGRRGLPRARRARRDPHRPRDRRAPRLEEGRRADAARDRAAALRRRRAARHRVARHQGAVRFARGDRAHRRRLAVLRVQAAVRLDARVRLGAPPRLPGRHPREQRRPVLASRAQKGAQFIQLCNQSDVPLAVPAEHHRLHGRQEGTSRKASSSTAPSSSTRCRTRRCPRSRS